MPSDAILGKIHEVQQEVGEKEVIVDDFDLDMCDALAGEEWKFKKFD